MKLPRSPRGGRLIAGTFGFLFAVSSSHASDLQDLPQGSLEVVRDVAQPGTCSNLTWKISDLSGITEMLTIGSTGRIIPKRNLRMRVRVLGLAFKSEAGLLPLQSYWSMNDGAWQPIFYGTSADVKPSNVLVDTAVTKDDCIDFGGRGWNDDWLPFHHTRTEDDHVTVLRNGDKAPPHAPSFDRNDVQSYLKPYLSGDRISIGERSLIVLLEAYTDGPGGRYFDMQDHALLVTFE